MLSRNFVITAFPATKPKKSPPIWLGISVLWHQYRCGGDYKAFGHRGGSCCKLLLRQRQDSSTMRSCVKPSALFESVRRWMQIEKRLIGACYQKRSQSILPYLILDFSIFAESYPRKQFFRIIPRSLDSV